MTTQDDMTRKRQRTVAWVVGISMVGLMFDGYDLVVYGTVVSTFLRDPSHLGPVDPALAGALGSYALLGVLFGALLAGTFNDRIGRRRTMLGAYAWFSVGMLATALTHTATTFGIFRFMTGLGVGALLATTAAMVSEYAPPGKKNLYNTIAYNGVPLGSLLWLSTTRPDGTPLVRPVAAQDTGGAIVGEIRADLFWGTGDAAGDLAGQQNGEPIRIDAAYVNGHLGELAQDEDLSRYIL